MDFDEIAEKVLSDSRTKRIPILYVIEVLIILDDLDMFKEVV